MKRVPILATLLCAAVWVSCQTGGTDFQPIVIDLSAAKSATPTAAETATSTPAPTPTPTPRAAAPSSGPAKTPAAGPAPAPTSAPSPEAVVVTRLDAYNRRSLDSLASLYSADARIFEPPDKVRDSGVEQIRQALAQRFSSPDWSKIEVTGRLIEGRYVVERQTESRGDGRARSSIVVSEVREGKIANVWIYAEK